MNTRTRCCQEMSLSCSDVVACGSESGLSGEGRFTCDHFNEKNIIDGDPPWGCRLAVGRRRAEAPDDGSGDINEVAVMHPDAVSMCSSVEHHFRVTHETRLDEHALQVQATEWRHCAFFAIGVELDNLAFGRKPKCHGARKLAQPVELN